MARNLSLAVAITLALAATLTACGRQAPLERPQAEQQTDGTTVQRSASGPSRPFILDGLVR